MEVLILEHAFLTVVLAGAGLMAAAAKGVVVSLFPSTACNRNRQISFAAYKHH